MTQQFNLLKLEALTQIQSDLESNVAQYRDEAQAAAMAAGDVDAAFDTYAEADASLPGLSEGDKVVIWVDETHDGTLTRYVVENGALVFKTSSGTGDMRSNVFDPNNIEGDVFDLSNQYGNKPTEFATVADLLADTNLGYSAAQKADQVAAGMIVTAQGFRYEVAASDATGHHVETDGGVKLYVLPAGDGHLHALAFGVDATPATDNLPALQKWAKAAGAPRKGAPGTYEISATLDVANPDGHVTDFGGMEIKPHSTFADEAIVAADGWYNVEGVAIDMGGSVDPDDTDIVTVSGYDGIALALGPSSDRAHSPHVKGVVIRNATSHTNRDLLLIQNSDYMDDSGDFRFEDCRMRECLRVRAGTHSVINGLTTVRAGFRSATISNSSKNVVVRHINILDPADVGSLGSANLHLYMSGEAAPAMEDCFFEDVYVTPGTSPACLIKVSRGALNCGLRRAYGRMIMAVLDDAVIGSRGSPGFVFEDINIENTGDVAEASLGAVLWAAPHATTGTGAENGTFRNINIKGKNRRGLSLVGRDGGVTLPLTGLRIDDVHIETNGNPFYLSRELTLSDCLVTNSQFISTGNSRGFDLDLANVVSIEMDFDNVRIEAQGDAYAARLQGGGTYRFHNSTLIRGANAGGEPAIFSTGSADSEFVNTSIKGGMFSPHAAALWRNSTNLSVPDTEVVATDSNFTLQALYNAPTVIHTGTLSANRTITLSATRPRGSFKIVRTGGGDFTLSVGGLKSLATNEWCEVTYNGSAWVLTGFGTM